MQIAPLVEISRLKIAVYFSCGEPSAVAVKVLQTELQPTDELAIVRCLVPNEHPDNERFAADCGEWFGQPVMHLASDEYADCWDVWERRRYLNGINGAPCTFAMKKHPRQQFEATWQPDVTAYGFTIEEADRAERFRRQNPEIRLDTPLIRAGLSASDCAAIVARAGIERPAMYRLGDEPCLTDIISHLLDRIEALEDRQHGEE